MRGFFSQQIPGADNGLAATTASATPMRDTFDSAVESNNAQATERSAGQIAAELAEVLFASWHFVFFEVSSLHCCQSWVVSNWRHKRSDVSRGFDSLSEFSLDTLGERISPKKWLLQRKFKRENRYSIG
jgi:hypothetical protein